MTYYNAEHYCDPTAGAAEQHINDQARVVGAARAGKGAMMQSIKFDVPGPPQGKGRPRARNAGGYVHMYTPAKTREYEAWIAACYRRAAGDAKLLPPIQLEIVARMPIPSSYTKARRRECILGLLPHTGKPDVDNIAKADADALNGVAYADDTQITTLAITKRYGDPVGLLVRLKGEAVPQEVQLETVGSQDS